LISDSRAAKGERGIWQRRYWEHTLRNEDDFVRHLDYIHFNPVKHGHTVRVRDWPFSSFRRWVRLGAYPVDWAGVADHDRRSGLADFTTEQGIKRHPPHLAARCGGLSGLIGDVPGQVFNPFRGIALALLVGGHRLVAFGQVARQHVRSRGVIQKAADPAPPDDAVQARVNLVIDGDGELF
jgi:hypothetical protein